MQRFTSITVLCCAAAVAVGAAERQGSTAGAPAPSTLTGCVQAGQAQNTFILTVAGDPGTGTAGTAGTASGDRTTSSSPHATGTPGNSPIKTLTYQLAPTKAEIDLTKFVGQRVRVTGTLDPTTKPSVASSTDTATTSSPDANRQDKSTPVVTTTEATKVQAQRLQVTSVTPVGGSCQAP
jgi:hypothetical protein